MKQQLEKPVAFDIGMGPRMGVSAHIMERIAQIETELARLGELVERAKDLSVEGPRRKKR